MSSTVWKSERLVYRAPEPSDDLFLAYLAQDPQSFTQAAPFIARPNATTEGSSSREWIAKCFLGVMVCLPLPDSPTSPKEAAEPLVDADGKEKPRPTPRPIGYFTLMSDDAVRQGHHRHADIGITLADGYTGKGYGSEAIEWGLGWGFQMAGLHRIGIGGFSYNPKAIQLYRRLGFVQEGVKREFLWFDGKYGDLIELSMLENEWREREAKKKTLVSK